MAGREEPGKGRLRAIRTLHTRKGRERQGRTLIEGVRLVEAALEAGVQPEMALCTARLLQTERGRKLWSALQGSGCGFWEVGEATLAELATTETPQGVLAVIRLPVTPAAALLTQEHPFLLVVDGVQDPGNLGTMLRTAAAAGATGALLGRGTVEPGNPKVLRAAMGAAFTLPLAVEADLPAALRVLGGRGVAVLAGDLAGESNLFELDVGPPAAVVVGSEAHGLSPEVKAAVARRVRIPMAPGVESLNAAVAAALLLYEVARPVHRHSLVQPGPSALPGGGTL
ncbi:MAG TPA: RNA methyltransferase [Firmicutes bacterium]|nr:RNA methyltransferase [Bacillota bacterium]